MPEAKRVFQRGAVTGINTEDRLGRTPIHLAASCLNAIQALAELVKPQYKPNLNAPNRRNERPLYTAVGPGWPG